MWFLWKPLLTSDWSSLRCSVLTSCLLEVSGSGSVCLPGGRLSQVLLPRLAPALCEGLFICGPRWLLALYGEFPPRLLFLSAPRRSLLCLLAFQPVSAGFGASLKHLLAESGQMTPLGLCFLTCEAGNWSCPFCSLVLGYVWSGNTRVPSI